MTGLQVIKKYGDLYGAERIAELLGLDKSALDFNPTEETVTKEASLLSWCGIGAINSHKAGTACAKIEGKQKMCTFYVSVGVLFFSFFRLSSIDTKYHVWKMGVVFTDNVSLT